MRIMDNWPYLVFMNKLESTGVAQYPCCSKNSTILPRISRDDREFGPRRKGVYCPQDLHIKLSIERVAIFTSLPLIGSLCGISPFLKESFSSVQNDLIM